MNTQELEKPLGDFFKGKLPALPPGVKEFIVKIAPWLAILSVILSAIGLLGLLGLSPLLVLGGAGVLWHGIFVAATLILTAMAIPGLRARTYQGWQYIFFSTLVSAVYNLVTGNLLGLVIGLFISLYILFQVREYYR